MLPLTGRRRFFAKPPRTMKVEFDPGWAAERDLRFATLFDSNHILYDLSINRWRAKHVGTPNNSSSYLETNALVGAEHARFNGTSSRYTFGSIVNNEPLSFQDVDIVSVAARFYTTGSENYREIATKASGSSGAGGWTFGVVNSTKKCWLGSNGNYRETSGTSLYSADTLHSYCSKIHLPGGGSSGISGQWWIDGASVGTASVPGVNFPSGTATFTIGGRHGTSGNWNGGLEYVYLFGAPMTTEWAAELHRNPYRYLRQQEASPIYFLPLGGGPGSTVPVFRQHYENMARR